MWLFLNALYVTLNSHFISWGVFTPPSPSNGNDCSVCVREYVRSRSGDWRMFVRTRHVTVCGRLIKTAHVDVTASSWQPRPAARAASLHECPPNHRRIYRSASTTHPFSCLFYATILMTVRKVCSYTALSTSIASAAQRLSRDHVASLT